MREKPPDNIAGKESSLSPERGSGLVRIANLSSEQEREGLRAFAELLADQEHQAYERKGTPAEREIIAGVLDAMPGFVRDYGGRPVENLSETDVHFVDEARISEEHLKLLLAGTAGFYDFRRQRLVILPDKTSLLTTAQRIVHEVLHMESFLSLTAETETDGDGEKDKILLHARRVGLSVFDDAHAKRFFRDIDEAVIEELTARFDVRYLTRIRVLASEIERRGEFRTAIEPAQRNDVAAVTDAQIPGGRWETTVQNWRYGAERRKLKNIIAAIYAAHKDQFGSEEAVFNRFAEAIFTGRLLKIARLVEKTFGKGAFRKLGEETMLAG